MPCVGWGRALADFDNDGWPDSFVANGHVDDNRRQLGQPVDYAEPPLLFANLKGKRFRLATRDAGPYFDAKHVGRGAAFGDLDDDGDIDIVVNHKDGPPPCSATTRKTDNHWIRLDLARDQEQPRRHRRPRRGRRRRPDDLPPAQGGLQHASRPTTPGS